MCSAETVLLVRVEPGTALWVVPPPLRAPLPGCGHLPVGARGQGLCPSGKPWARRDPGLGWGAGCVPPSHSEDAGRSCPSPGAVLELSCGLSPPDALFPPCGVTFPLALLEGWRTAPAGWHGRRARPAPRAPLPMPPRPQGNAFPWLLHLRGAVQRWPSMNTLTLGRLSEAAQGCERGKSFSPTGGAPRCLGAGGPQRWSRGPRKPLGWAGLHRSVEGALDVSRETLRWGQESGIQAPLELIPTYTERLTS